jgi:hypothetical protein
MDKDYLTFKPVSVSRPSSERHDYDVICDGAVVGQIIYRPAAPESQQRMWSLAYSYYQGRMPTHGYEATREAAMAAFAKSWRKS